MKFDTTVRQTKEKLLAVLNESGLHIDVMDMMLELLYMTVHRQAEELYKASLNTPEGGDKEDGAS